MRRALALSGAPGLSVPLRFLLTAPFFATAAGALLAWHGADALATRWAGATLALTHLLTLGFLTMTMAGALLQMLPVVAGSEVPWQTLLARLAWPALVGGALVLAAAFESSVPALFIAAAIVLAVPLALLCAAFAAALARRAPAGTLAMVAGMRLALLALALTVTLGVLLALFLAGKVILPALVLTDLHAGWGLLGWVAMLVAAVAYQVIPMFQATPDYPKWFALALPPVLAGALAAWSAAALTGPEYTPFAGAALALCAAALSGATLLLLARRKRPGPDVTTLYWRLSMGSLGTAAFLFLWPGEAPEWRGLMLGALFIGGFAMGAVNGMLYKIVPFLLWFHLQQLGVPKAALPGAQHWIEDRRAKQQFWMHAAATALLGGAVLAPGLLARPAGMALCLASAKLAYDLAGAALRCRRIARASALERA